MGSRLESNSNAVRKRIEQHKFDEEDGEEYEASKFGGFGDYFRRKKIKLQNLDAEIRKQNADKPQLFRGIVVHVNGYTQPSLNDLHTMVVAYGGGFLQYLDGKTMATHVIAANLTAKKAEEFRKYRIVKPAWVVDSIKAGRLLPWSDYRVIDQGSGQNVLGFEGGSMRSQAGGLRHGYRDQTDTSWYTKQVEEMAAQLDDDAQKGPPEAISPDSAGSHQSAQGHMLQDQVIGDVSTAPEDSDDIRDLLANRQAVDDEADPGPLNASFAESFPMGSMEDADLLQAEGDLQAGEEMTGVDDNQQDEVPGEPPAPEVLVPVAHPEASVKLESRDENQTLSTSAKEEPGGEPEQSRRLTAEEHNAILLSDPKIWKSTVVNPGFLKQYYEESRLHHLSTWKAELKSQLQTLAQERTASQKARLKRPAGARRYVLHVDFDCFFAAVSLKQYPQYEDKPVAVAHGHGAGAEIASCNYHARKFGIKNGSWMKGALELCPSLKVLPYDFKAYEAASRDFYAAVIDTGGIVQSVSIDEALVDISIACIEAGGHDGLSTHEGSIYREQAKADEIGSKLRALIKEKTGCAVSVGIGNNILLAKVALRKAKPAGQHQIKPEEVLDFIGELSVRDLPGVAYSIGGKLEEIGVKLVKDARQLTKEKLMNTLGPKTGEKIFEYARGIDRVEVGEQVMRKSVSAEVNWGVRFVTQEQADEFVRSLCEELHRRLLNESVKGRQLTMKIMKRAADAGRDPPKHLGHGRCDVFNKSTVLGVSTNDAAILSREAISIMKGYGFPPGELRGIGVQMTKLEPLQDFTPLAGGQKRLQFQSAPAINNKDDSDTIETPKKPERFVKHPAATLDGSPAGGGAALNTLGTQFVLPSQVDPEVLAELPEDIRLKLAGPAKSIKQDTKDSKQRSLEFKAAETSTAPAADMPSASQLDQETLDALPEDIRAEVLAMYKQDSSPSASRQVLLPQSPHKSRLSKPAKKVTPTKKKPGRPRGVRTVVDPHSTLLQSNIVASRNEAVDANILPEDEIAPDVLAALPPDIREEVLAEQRNSRLKNRGGLNVPARRKMRTDLDPQSGPRVVVLPPRPPRPTFTAQKLSALPELRDAIGSWVEALGGEGPEEEDVGTLAKYLARVVQEEYDMDKAVGVVKWMKWVVSELERAEQPAWKGALEQVQRAVQQAVRERGLGDVRFD